MRRFEPGDRAGFPALFAVAGSEPSRAGPRNTPARDTPALDVALRLLARRERSVAELRTRLTARGYEDQAVETVLERLREAGLQDDGRFAAQFTSDAAARGLSARRIQGELLGRGIDRELAAASAAKRPEAEERRARAVAVKRAAGMGNLAPEIRYRRLAGFLARRGYERETCRQIAAEVAGFDPMSSL